MAGNEDEVVEGLDRVLTRLAMTEEDKLEQVITCKQSKGCNAASCECVLVQCRSYDQLSIFQTGACVHQGGHPMPIIGKGLVPAWETT